MSLITPGFEGVFGSKVETGTALGGEEGGGMNLFRNGIRPVPALALIACAAILAATSPAQDTNRIVLAELFTGSECPPCAGADEGFDLILQNYDRDEVVVLEYHIDIPAPDPMSTKDTHDRANYYMFGSAAAPTAYFDGGEAYRGGGIRAWGTRYFNRVKDFITERREKPPEFSVGVTAGQGFSDGSVRVNLRALEKLGDEDLRLHIIVYEDNIEYTGRNTIPVHHNVVRLMVDGPDGIPVELDDGIQEVVRPIPRDAIAGDNYGVVVFVQERSSYEVLQAREVRFGPELPDARQLHDQGVVLARQGNLDGAIEFLAQAVDVDPAAAQGHFTLGMAYAGKRMLEESAYEWEKALEIDPENADLQLRISLLYEDMGNRQAAISHLEKFLEITPNHPQVEAQRARLQRLKGG